MRGMTSNFPFIVYKSINIVKREGIKYKMCQIIYQAEKAHMEWPDHPQSLEEMLTVTILRTLA